MRELFSHLAAISLALLSLTGHAQSSASVSPSAATQGSSWLDEKPGHYVNQLIAEAGASTLDYGANAFTSDGLQMIYWEHRNLGIVTLKTREARLLLRGPLTSVALDTNRSEVYFTRRGENHLFRLDIQSGQSVILAKLPQDAIVSSVNFDSTLVVGWYPSTNSVSGSHSGSTSAPSSGNDSQPGEIFVYAPRRDRIHVIAQTGAEPQQISFSPRIPNLMFYVAYDPSRPGNTVWMLNLDSAVTISVQPAVMTHEIAQHSFWGADGTTIWYDLQRPEGEDFYLATFNSQTGARMLYPLARNDWSVHYSIAPEDLELCGDGSSKKDQAHANDGNWIDLFVARKPIPDHLSSNLINVNSFRVIRLASLTEEDYEGTKPNARFTPDHQYVIFTSVRDGSSHVLEVEVRHARSGPSNPGSFDSSGKE